MSTTTSTRDQAQIDFLVDEAGNPIERERDAVLGALSEPERTVAATGPTGWWRYGLVALLIVAAILLGMQLLSGNKGTNVIPGTPVAAPQNGVPVPGAQ